MFTNCCSLLQLTGQTRDLETQLLQLTRASDFDWVSRSREQTGM